MLKEIAGESKIFQVCVRCVMDESANDIVFDEGGRCNYCSDLLNHALHPRNKKVSERKQELYSLIERIKEDGKGKQYDCIVGVSGGVDSSWALVQAVEFGLRPLAVHMDNGWNSELAQNNIANLVLRLNVDLYTHVIHWDEYKKLMQAFFDADVIDIELLYDNAMLATNFNLAAKHGVKYILSGCNVASEGMPTPNGWNWFKYDKKNIKAIGKQFANTHLKTFPAIGTFGFIWASYIRKIKWLNFLDYFEFNKFEAVSVLQQKYGYKPYVYKHYESIFTRFYQGYILPEKFAIDKRKLHLATLVASGQMTRKDALESIQGSPYPSQQALDEDKAYFIKKMGWSEPQLEQYLHRPGKSHNMYPSEKALYDLCLRVYFKWIKKT